MKFSLALTCLPALATAQSYVGPIFKIWQASGNQAGLYWASYGSTPTTRSLGLSQPTAGSRFRLAKTTSGQLIVSDIEAPVWYNYTSGDTGRKQLQPRETQPPGTVPVNCALSVNTLDCSQYNTGYQRLAVCDGDTTSLYLLHDTDASKCAILDWPQVAFT